jgi:glycosyltransferase involved in cell wall biosynthesis
MVSVVMPVYNTEKYLKRCLEALVNQTIPHSELEIIAVNDGSTDSSPEILAEYADKYPELIKVYNKTNGGQATARNLGIRMAKGDYIGFADSDDYVDVTMFDKLYKLAQSEDADLVECHYHSMLELPAKEGEPLEYKEIGTRGTISAHEDARELFLNPQVSPWNKLYRKSILVDNEVFFPEGIIYEDTAFYIKTLPFIKKHAYLDESLVYYSVRPSSTMTKNLGKKVGDIFSVFDDIRDYYRTRNLLGEYKDELEYFCVKIAFCSNLSRIGRVKNGYLRNELLDKTFDYVRKNYPDYKKNKFFVGKIGMYIKSVARWNSGIYAMVLSKVMIG